MNNPDGQALDDETRLRVEINDYIPAVYESLFPTIVDRQALTSAETIIAYLEEVDNQDDFFGCNSYFRY